VGFNKMLAIDLYYGDVGCEYIIWMHAHCTFHTDLCKSHQILLSVHAHELRHTRSIKDSMGAAQQLIFAFRCRGTNIMFDKHGVNKKTIMLSSQARHSCLSLIH
jgi:hypothetical protein